MNDIQDEHQTCQECGEYGTMRRVGVYTGQHGEEAGVMYECHECGGERFYTSQEINEIGKEARV